MSYLSILESHEFQKIKQKIYIFIQKMKGGINYFNYPKSFSLRGPKQFIEFE